jgi:hypothetical protein
MEYLIVSFLKKRPPHMDDATLSQRILEAYDDLTRRERLLADLLLEDPDTLVLKSATDISVRARVSKVFGKVSREGSSVAVVKRFGAKSSS